MKRPDPAHRMTDEQLAALEKRIAAEYKKAADELQETIDAYFESFEKWDEEQKKKLAAGEITKDYYKTQRTIKIARGERFEALRDRIADRMNRAKEVANAYTDDTMMGIYSLNRNYASYTIEKEVGSSVSFDIWDEHTVKRLIVKQPDLMPYYSEVRASLRGFDLKEGKSKITSVVTSSIMQGKSIKGISDDLQRDIPTMNRTSAIRAARTAVTGAQNAGRLDSYIAAEQMGIEMERVWIATLDNRTRHDHAVADGQIVGVEEPFDVGGENLMFPGDPSGSGWNIYNCRCTQIAQVKGVDMSDAKRRARNAETGENVVIENMTFEEWQSGKRKEEKTQELSIQQKFAIATESFKPAESIQDAEQYAKRFVSEFESKYSGHVSYKGLSLETANEINRVITQVYESFDVERMANISVMNKRDKIWKNTTAEASYKWGSTGGMFINQSYYKDSKTLAAHQKEVQAALDSILSQKDVARRVATGKQKEYLEAILATGRTNVGGINAEDTVMHEMGHFLDDVLFGLQKTSSKFDMRQSMDKYAGGISGYATASSAEYVAESFVAWSKGETEILDPELIKVFEGATKWKK